MMNEIPESEYGKMMKYLHEIPEHLEKDREWGALLLIFRFLDDKNHYLRLVHDYVDPVKEQVDIKGLRKVSGSTSQVFLVKLACHLFNCSDNPLPKDGLSGMDSLGGDYLAVALKAIAMRFGGG